MSAKKLARRASPAALCANITEEQRDWCERYTFREWPEFLIERGVVTCDTTPTAQEWWHLMYRVYQDATGQEPPELSIVTRN